MKNTKLFTTINEFKQYLNSQKLNENFNNKEKVDYSEAFFNLDKFMPDDEDIQNEYYSILDDTSMTDEEKIKELTSFFYEYIDKAAFDTYFEEPEDEFGEPNPNYVEFTIKEFAEYIVSLNGVNDDQTFESKIIRSPKQIIKQIIRDNSNFKWLNQYDINTFNKLETILQEHGYGPVYNEYMLKYNINDESKN